MTSYCWVVITMNNLIFPLLVTTRCGRCQLTTSSSLIPEAIVFWRFFRCWVLLDLLTLEKTGGIFSILVKFHRLEPIVSWCRGGHTANTVGPLIKHCLPPSILLLVVDLMGAWFTMIPLTWFKNLISTCFGSKITLLKWDATSFQIWYQNQQIQEHPIYKLNHPIDAWPMLPVEQRSKTLLHPNTIFHYLSFKKQQHCHYNAKGSYTIKCIQ